MYASMIYLLSDMMRCIRNGHAILIENVEEVLDPALEPVLSKALFKRGGQVLLRLGTEDVPYDENFVATSGFESPLSA